MLPLCFFWEGGGCTWGKRCCGCELCESSIAPVTDSECSVHQLALACSSAHCCRSLLCAPSAVPRRFKDTPHVAGPPHIRFFAGAPLISSNGGHRFGALHGLCSDVLCTACRLAGKLCSVISPHAVCTYQLAPMHATGSMNSCFVVCLPCRLLGNHGLPAAPVPGLAAGAAGALCGADGSGDGAGAGGCLCHVPS